MSRIYKSPPVVEALCEFQFSSESWDWTIPGLIFQEIKDKFPQKRQVNRVEFAMAAFQDKVSQQLKGSADRMHFLNNEKTALVQVGPDLLVVNHLQPYPHWQKLQPLISEMYDVYQRIAKPAEIKRIALRYINKIHFRRRNHDISNGYSSNKTMG